MILSALDRLRTRVGFVAQPLAADTIGRVAMLAPMDQLLAHFDALTSRQNPRPFLQAALARISAEGDLKSWCWGAQASVTARLRVASVSKIATAHAVLAIAQSGALDLAAPLATYLPELDVLPSIPIATLLNHTSGLTDVAGYVVEPPSSLLTHVAENATLVVTTPPGRFFRYANLNYLLLGHVLERAAGDRFDRLLAAHVLKPAGVEGGFNWAGVPPSARADRLPLRQRVGDARRITADAPDADWGADLVLSDGRGIDLSSYTPGSATSLFSPHAGLRANVSELARLARLIGAQIPSARKQRTETWTFTRATPNGEDCDGLFTRFGHGLTIYRAHPQIPGHLVGHAGHAMGFTGGAWYNLATETAWAYYLTGAPDQTAGLETEVFYDADELPIMQAL